MTEIAPHRKPGRPPKMRPPGIAEEHAEAMEQAPLPALKDLFHDIAYPTYTYLIATDGIPDALHVAGAIAEATKDNLPLAWQQLFTVLGRLTGTRLEVTP